MVQEMSQSPTEIRREETSGNAGTHSKEIDIDKLRTFSRSLENLNSETLYSKWKRARGEGSKSARRPRSLSLTTLPNITRGENDNQPECRQPTRKNSFHVLQENVFRPRCWTIGASPMEVIKEHNAMHSCDLNNNTQGSASQWEQKRRNIRQQFRVTLHLPHKQHSPPPPDKDPKDPSPIVAQLVSEEGESSQMANSASKKRVSNLFIESVRIEIPPQSMSMPASPNFLMRKPETAWDTDESAMEPCRGLNSTVVKDASEMRANNERSKTLQNTFSLGCTYAVVSQPSPRATDNSVKPPAMEMSNGITNEQRAELEEQFKKLKKVSLELDRAEIEEGIFPEKLYTLPEIGTKEGLESQPLRRFSELHNSITARRNSSRPTAKALLENITNTAHKTERERIQQIEKAFEWIRKELAELRAQDKDIMRTFTKIQAGIRKIKLQRALSGDMDEPYEFDIVDHSLDLSSSFSYIPIVRDFHNTFPRRASLI